MLIFFIIGVFFNVGGFLGFLFCIGFLKGKNGFCGNIVFFGEKSFSVLLVGVGGV